MLSSKVTGSLSMRRTLRFATLVFGRVVMAAIPLNAAEQPLLMRQATPLEAAQKIEGLTQGGWFNPGQNAPLALPNLSQSAPDDLSGADATQPSTLADRPWE